VGCVYGLFDLAIFQVHVLGCSELPILEARQNIELGDLDAPDAMHPGFVARSALLGQAAHGTRELDVSVLHRDVDQSVVDQSVPAQRVNDLRLDLGVRPNGLHFDLQLVLEAGDASDSLGHLRGQLALSPRVDVAFEANHALFDGDIDLVGVGCGVLEERCVHVSSDRGVIAKPRWS
jgi:hypothetical protein